MANGIDLARAAAGFDPEEVVGDVRQAKDDRQRIADEFPRDQWAFLPLERYALGAGSGDGETFCRLLEFRTDHLGSIRGGSAAKHIMYLHNDGIWRQHGPLAGMGPQRAWERLRGEFVTAFDAAAEGDFDALDGLEALRFGQALVTKALAGYFPDRFLPIYSAQHLKHFIELFGGSTYQAYAGSEWAWGANRRLHRLVYEHEAFRGWDPDTVARFLYSNYDPRRPGHTVYKIAPGPNAELWEECLEGGFICIGWDEAGDLGQYESDTELKQALDHHRPQERQRGHTRLARYLLAFRDLRPGDVVVANRGTSEVLAVGTVSGGYVHDTSRRRFRNVVPVEWDLSYAQPLDPPQGGWRQTFARVQPLLMHRLEANRAGRQSSVPAREPTPQVQRILDLLQSKGQVILYGPPGTGKTRVAHSTALALAGRPEADDFEPRERRRSIAELFSGEASGGATTTTTPTGPSEGAGSVPSVAAAGNDRSLGSLRMVTFHPSYGYEDFVEGYKPAPAADSAGLNLQLTDGIFPQLCREAENEPEQTFLLIIDEINRGDLPRIFGELITFLEKDKRGLPMTLPVSKRTFRVPDNVAILATMNTADRSVGHLDAALRRRFAFVELAPDIDAVSASVGPLSLDAFLEELNRRIVLHLDADHQLGHAYLMRNDVPLVGEEQVSAAFYTDIAPLLADHCLGRAELLRPLLGDLLDPATGAPKQMAAGDLVLALAREFDAAGNDGDGA